MKLKMLLVQLQLVQHQYHILLFLLQHDVDSAQRLSRHWFRCACLHKFLRSRNHDWWTRGEFQCLGRKGGWIVNNFVTQLQASFADIDSARASYHTPYFWRAFSAERTTCQ